MIYAILVEGSRYVKFGKAENVKKRLSGLQTGCPYELKLIAVADWPDAEEGAIHSYLNAIRCRGEWFSRDSSVERVLGLMRDGQRGFDEWKRLTHALKRTRSPRYANRVREMARAPSGIETWWRSMQSTKPETAATQQ